MFVHYLCCFIRNKLLIKSTHPKVPSSLYGFEFEVDKKSPSIFVAFDFDAGAEEPYDVISCNSLSVQKTAMSIEAS